MKTRLTPYLIALSLAIVAVANPGQAQTAAPGPAPTLRLHFTPGKEWAPLPYETVKGVILIQVKLNGQPITALLDNGADRTFIDAGFADRAGIKLGTPAANVVTGSASLLSSRSTASVVFEVPRAITLTGPLTAIDLKQMSASLDRQVDAVLGADVLDNLALMVDPDTMQVSIVASGAITPGSNATRLPVSAEGVVDAAINGQPVKLKLDLGFAGVVRVTEPAWQRVFPAGTAVRPDSQTSADGIKRASKAADGELLIGGVSVSGATINGNYVSTSADGILGFRFMSQFVTIFDGPKKLFVMMPRQGMVR